MAQEINKPQSIQQKAQPLNDDESQHKVDHQDNCHTQSHQDSFFLSFLNLYSYTRLTERLLIVIGILIGLGSGISHPLFIYMWFQQLQLVLENRNDLDSTMEEFHFYLFAYFALGCSSLIINTVLFAIWKYISQSVTRRIRVRYLEEFTKLSIGKVDKLNGHEQAGIFRNHTLNIQKSIGDKVALFFNLIGITSSGFAAALWLRWTYTLYLLFVAPFGAAVLVYFIYIQIKKHQIQARASKNAENKAIQATSMIKTVKMFRGEQKQSVEYQKILSSGQIDLHNFSCRLGLATGLFYLILNILVGIGFIMGLQCVRGTDFCPVSLTGTRYKLSEFLTIFFQIFFCTFNFLQLGSNYSAIKSAIESSKLLYKFIDQSKMADNKKGFKVIQQIGQIQFSDVCFSYPLTQKRVLSHFSLRLLHHKFNVISGISGSGKSTIVSLLLNQYKPQSGNICVNGVPIEEINKKYWLKKVGIVAQQPVLFEGTIRDNVLVGKADATDEEVREALKNASILDFVDSLSEGLDFQIGAGGSKLSGGQKQRIAIARALVKQPQLLVLDEATSALDPNSEKEIQQSIDRIRKIFEKRMTIVCIAHRLRTIKNADKIFLLQNGAIREEGAFQDLEYFRQIRQKEEEQQKAIEQGQFLSLIYVILVKLKIIKVGQKSDTTSTQLTQSTKSVKIMNEESIYSYLYQNTTRQKWYVACLILSALSGLNHILTAIIISYSANQMGLLYLSGTLTDWCQNTFDNSQILLNEIHKIFTNWNTHEECNATLDSYMDQSEFYLYVLLSLSGFVLALYFVKVTMLSRIEAQIAFNLRKKLFRKLLNHKVSFFQEASNESGQAACQFSKDSQDCSILLSSYIPIVLQNFCCAAAAVCVCFAFQWRFGLLSLLITPLIALSYYIAMLFIGGYEDSSLQDRNRSNRIANQLILNYKAVLMLGHQQKMLEKYRQATQQSFITILKTGGKIGLLYGLGYFILDIAVGFSLYFAIIISKNNPQIAPLNIMIFMITTVFSGFIIGNNFFFVSHLSTSRTAGERIVKLINNKTEEKINVRQTNKFSNNAEQVKGRIQFRNVSFKYKEDGNYVLNSISLTIEAGSKVAFVGPSGCGKSTLLQLLLRFYDFQGEILLDGKNIYDYDLYEYRGFFTVLNQQSSLFAGTIDDNIRYNNIVSLFFIQVNQERMQTVCKISCAFTLNQEDSQKERITKFRERIVGPKGSNISGGEKQRAACARALVRGGAVFVIDEGTSALDRKTQLKVQSGVLEQFARKTVINVAHRMETIVKSDVIFVLEAGKLKEMGSYSELMRRKAYFYNFVNGNKYSE